MNKRPALTLAYITYAPESAADVLENLEPDVAAAFLDEIPVRHSATVLGHMSPWCGARCLAKLASEHVASIMARLTFHNAVGMMRLIPASQHAAIFEGLPGRLAKRMRSALNYPIGSVGAWIDPDVPTFANDVSVKDTLRYLKQSEDISHVFLHHRANGDFAGALPLPLLMRSEPNARLSELPVVRIAPISSRSTLASVAGDEAWDSFLLLPVVGRGKNLVGGLSRASLRRGLTERGASLLPASTANLSGQMLGALGASCGGLLRLFVGAEPGPPDRNKEAFGG